MRCREACGRVGSVGGPSGPDRMDGEVIERITDEDAEGSGTDYDSDLGFLHNFPEGSHGETSHDDRVAYAGPGLTEPERELADEQERIRDRFERLARDSGMGGGGGGLASDDDAMAVIDAADRFGVAALEDDSEQTIQERERIAMALADFAVKAPKPANEYHFFGIIQKQSTTSQGNINLTIEVPWEHRHEVFRALAEMPFACLIRLTGAESNDE